MDIVTLAQISGAFSIPLALIKVIEILIQKMGWGNSKNNDNILDELTKMNTNHLTHLEEAIREGNRDIVNAINQGNKDMTKAITDMHVDLIKEIGK